MTYPIKSPRKLIEVALPLDLINEAAKQEKTVRHGHPGNFHRWWARRPLAAARAVIFAQMVNDPGYQQGGGFKYGKNKKEAADERKRLFRILEELVLWENINNERVIEEARVEISRSWREVCELNRDHPDAVNLFNPEKLPALHDPFAGGGAIPLEAQRLGLEAFASDLNPVAVTINKAMIEIPPKFSGRIPVGPTVQGKRGRELGLNQEWTGISGLAEDVRRYGIWITTEAKKRIGYLYPKVEITADMVKERPDLKPYLGQSLTVISWLWARTVKSPNPAYSNVDIPLVSSFVLCAKAGKEAYVEPIIENSEYHFTVRVGVSPDIETTKGGTTAGRWNAFRCLMSDVPVTYDYIRSEGVAGRMGTRLMAIVAEGSRSRVYLSPTALVESSTRKAQPTWIPELEINYHPRDIKTQIYGLTKYGDLFTSRQLVALTTLSDLIGEAVPKIKADAIASGMDDDGRGLNVDGDGATAYSEAIAVYLAAILSKSADSNNSLCPWEPVAQCPRQLFGRQAIPMLWDFAEANPLHDSSGGFITNLEVSLRALQSFPKKSYVGIAIQEDATVQITSKNKVVSTDPPYYDNIGYADLSDFFYVWLRKTLKPIYPNLYTTLAVPKAEELVATPYRHGNKDKAEAFFLKGMTEALSNLSTHTHPAFPVTIYYAFKQTETKEDTGTTSTGWVTFLEAVLRAGFVISGTWPLRTEQVGALKTNMNSLASSIVLVCRTRLSDALTISRREFIRELNQTLPLALDEMTKGTPDGPSPVAPVDLSQAIIGPGMAVFSKYDSVLEADGSPMSVRTALQLINRFLAEDDFDSDTQFCMHWFEQYGWKVGEYGQADVLARSKSTSVDGLAQAGVVEAGGGSVRLLKWSEYAVDWDPRTDIRLPIWEALHHLLLTFKQGGETAAGAVTTAIPSKIEAVRQLAYRLYTLCERQGWAEDARAYNELITSWGGIESAASNVQPAQRGLFD